MEFLWICIAIFLVVGFFLVLRVAKEPTDKEEEEMIAPQKAEESWTLDSVDEAQVEQNTDTDL